MVKIRFCSRYCSKGREKKLILRATHSNPRAPFFTATLRLAVKPPQSQNSERVKPPKSEYPTGIKSRNLIPPKHGSEISIHRKAIYLTFRKPKVLFHRIVITPTYRSPESPKSRTVPEVSLLRIFIPPMPIVYRRHRCLAY